MNITSYYSNQSLQAKKSQNPNFAANIVFKNMNKNEMRKCAAAPWSRTCSVNINNAQTRLRKFFCEEGQEGHKLINKIYGEYEVVKIKLTNGFGLTLNIEGSLSKPKNISMREVKNNEQLLEAINKN